MTAMPVTSLPFLRRGQGARHVLVVDDGTLVRLFYRNALEAAGFVVDEAINGLEAMEKVLSRHFDLLVVDVNMPKMDGFAFLRALRSREGVGSIPVLVTSTEAGAHDVATARTAGANYYLVKPVVAEDLMLYASILTGTPA